MKNTRGKADRGEQKKTRLGNLAVSSLVDILILMIPIKRDQLLITVAELLNIDSLHHFLAVGDGRLFKSLTGTQLLDDTGFFSFTFESLEGAFDVVAFLNGNNNHNLFVLF